MNRGIAAGAVVAVIGVAAGYYWWTQRQEATSPQPAASNTAPAVETTSTPASLPEPAAEPEGPPPPSFDIVRINPKGATVIAGRAEPGATVTVLSDGRPIGSVESDGNGEWVLVLDYPIEPGSHALSLSATASGGPTIASADNVVVVVPEAVRDNAGETETSTGQALALLVPGGEETPIAVLQTPGGSDGAGQGALALDVVEYDETGQVTVSGRALEGSRLRAYVDNEFAGAAEAAGGSWTIRPGAVLGPGEHELRIDQVDDSGNVLARIEAPIVRPKSVELAPGQKMVVVQPGTSLWQIAFSTYGEGLRYATIYAANKDRIADPDVIFPGQVFVLPAGDH